MTARRTPKVEKQQADLGVLNFAQGIPRQVCNVGWFLDTLSPGNRAIVESALANERIAHAEIYRQLSKPGLGLEEIPKTYSIRRHRIGECVCPKPSNLT